ARGRDPEAPRLFLRGHFLINRVARTDMLAGIGLLEQAVTADPSHARAWSTLSYAIGVASSVGFLTIAEGIPRARDAARRALELEPDLPEALLALGTVHQWYDRVWKAAETSFRRALEVAPGNAEALRAAGLLAYTLGRADEAIAYCRSAVDQDPLSLIGHTHLGRAYRGAGRNAEAEEMFRPAAAAPHPAS